MFQKKFIHLKLKSFILLNIAKDGSYLYKRMETETLSSYEKLNFIGRAVLFNKQNPKCILTKKDFNKNS